MLSKIHCKNVNKTKLVFYKEILFQLFYFKMSCLIQCHVAKNHMVTLYNEVPLVNMNQKWNASKVFINLC